MEKLQFNPLKIREEIASLYESLEVNGNKIPRLSGVGFSEEKIGDLRVRKIEILSDNIKTAGHTRGLELKVVDFIDDQGMVSPSLRFGRSEDNNEFIIYQSADGELITRKRNKKTDTFSSADPDFIAQKADELNFFRQYLQTAQPRKGYTPHRKKLMSAAVSLATLASLACTVFGREPQPPIEPAHISLTPEPTAIPDIEKVPERIKEYIKDRSIILNILTVNQSDGSTLILSGGGGLLKVNPEGEMLILGPVHLWDPEKYISEDPLYKELTIEGIQIIQGGNEQTFWLNDNNTDDKVVTALDYGNDHLVIGVRYNPDKHPGAEKLKQIDRISYDWRPDSNKIYLAYGYEAEDRVGTFYTLNFGINSENIDTSGTYYMAKVIQPQSIHSYTLEQGSSGALVFEYTSEFDNPTVVTEITNILGYSLGDVTILRSFDTLEGLIETVKAKLSDN